MYLQCYLHRVFNIAFLYIFMSTTFRAKYQDNLTKKNLSELYGIPFNKYNIKISPGII